MSELLRVALLLTVGLALGWFGRGWWDGIDIKATDASAKAQVSVNRASSASVEISKAVDNTRSASSRVEVITRTVTVDRGCEPGRGPVSDEMDQEMREVFK